MIGGIIGGQCPEWRAWSSVRYGSLPKPVAWPLGVALGELGDEAPAGVVDGPGHDDLGDEEEVAGGLLARRGDPLPSEPELLAAGGPGGEGQRLQAVEGGHVDLGAEDRLGDRDRHLDREVAAVAGEVGV